MATATIRLVQADTKPIIRVTLRDRATRLPLNLNGAQQIIFRFEIDEGVTYERAMQVVSAIQGQVLYQFQTGELQPGTLSCEVTVVYSDGRTLTSLQPATIGVRERLA